MHQTRQRLLYLRSDNRYYVVGNCTREYGWLTYIWYLAPALPLKTITIATKHCPPKAHITDSHILSPKACALDAAYHVETVEAVLVDQ